MNEYLAGRIAGLLQAECICNEVISTARYANAIQGARVFHTGSAERALSLIRDATSELRGTDATMDHARRHYGELLQRLATDPSTNRTDFAGEGK